MVCEILEILDFNWKNMFGIILELSISKELIVIAGV